MDLSEILSQTREAFWSPRTQGCLLGCGSSRQFIACRTRTGSYNGAARSGNAMIPLKIRTNAERRSLAITWDDGNFSLIPASRLRALSRAAQHIRSSIDGRKHSFDDVTLTSAEAIGSYAVRLVFSDGHDRGIYPWRYLREIADTQA
ncbi:MAG: DUF971 domain-containing protein [Mesorhizobium sp.]|nr:MAG: DUF971 domain-containing protein [Mesorhizobium sp.]